MRKESGEWQTEEGTVKGDRWRAEDTGEGKGRYEIEECVKQDGGIGRECMCVYLNPGFRELTVPMRKGT